MNGLDKPQPFEKPTGFRDYPPQVAAKKRKIEESIQTRLARWGYEEIVTPTLEFYDTVGNASAIPEQKMFKCMDRDGNTLVLRPDQTAPIARVVTSILQDQPLPLRLCYHANVFRAQENEAGRRAEFYQSGVELIGLSTAEADGEVIACAIEALEACKISSFCLAVGHVGLMEAWIKERVSDVADIERLKEFLEQRNLVGYKQYVESLSLEQTACEELLDLLTVHAEPPDTFKQKTQSSIVLEALDHLQAIWSYLRDMGVAENLSFDPSLTGSLHYYTGVTLEGYSASSGFPLLSGGRYDRLLDQFGRQLPATGFALKTDRLMEASPLADDNQKTVAILYDVHQRTEAFQKARALRNQGSIVTLHSEPVIQRAVDEVIDMREEAAADE